jgi:hypothetical protein
MGARTSVPSNICARPGTVIQRVPRHRSRLPMSNTVGARRHTPVLMGSLWRYRTATPSRVMPQG